MTKTIVNCNNCGSSLEISNAINFATCSNCQQSLKIIRTKTSTYTESSGSHSSRNNHINLKNKLVNKDDIYRQIEILDREWNNKLPGYMSKGTLPQEGIMQYIFTVIFILLIIGWMFFTASFAGYFSLFGLVGIFIIILSVVSYERKKAAYFRAKKRYEDKRLKLLNQVK